MVGEREILRVCKKVLKEVLKDYMLIHKNDWVKLQNNMETIREQVDALGSGQEYVIERDDEVGELLGIIR